MLVKHGAKYGSRFKMPTSPPVAPSTSDLRQGDQWRSLYLLVGANAPDLLPDIVEVQRVRAGSNRGHAWQKGKQRHALRLPRQLQQRVTVPAANNDGGGGGGLFGHRLPTLR